MKSIKNSRMDDLDKELEKLEASLNKVNKSHKVIDDKLRFKWQEIRDLDSKEKDLDKVRSMTSS